MISDSGGSIGRMSDPYGKNFGRQVTLTDFLLARIAEDEAGYGQMHETLRVAATRVTEGRSTVMTSETVLHRSKMLAECEVKRQLVERHADWIYEEECRGCGCDDGGTCWLLRGLGIVYADHPDYREEWRS